MREVGENHIPNVVGYAKRNSKNRQKENLMRFSQKETAIIQNGIIWSVPGV